MAYFNLVHNLPTVFFFFFLINKEAHLFMTNEDKKKPLHKINKGPKHNC